VESPRFEPLPNPDTEAFWEACRSGRIVLQRCAACRGYRHPPSPLCPACSSSQFEWVQASGRGTVWSFVIVRERLEGWDGEVPYVVALVELDEGVRMVTNVIGAAPEAVQVGMPVEASFEPGPGGVTLPKFRPAPH
jgi:uncharacterized protein